jgi:hypothetical protein
LLFLLSLSSDKKWAFDNSRTLEAEKRPFTRAVEIPQSYHNYLQGFSNFSSVAFGNPKKNRQR